MNRSGLQGVKRGMRTLLIAAQLALGFSSFPPLPIAASGHSLSAANDKKDGGKKKKDEEKEEDCALRSA